MNISIIIPVYNEKGRLEPLVKKLNKYYEVIIIDDASDILVESYINKKIYKNVKIITNTINIGYLKSIKHAIARAKGDIIVTMDGDGEHKPEDIEKLIQPIKNDICDIVFGKRPNIARISERFLLKIAKYLTNENIEDAGTGFRAIKSNYAKKINFGGMCTCGLLLMECKENQMRICEVDVDLPIVNKPRKIAWEHFLQFILILKYFFKTRVVGFKDY